MDEPTGVAPVCSLQGLLRDIELKGQVWLALLYSDGQLPATALCNAKAVTRWCRAHDPDNAGSVMAVWERVSGELQSKLGRGRACGSMHSTFLQYPYRSGMGWMLSWHVYNARIVMLSD